MIYLQGKFGQRLNQTQFALVANPSKFYELVFNDEYEVLSVDIISTQLVGVTYKYTNDYVNELPNTNPIVAAYVTAQARLKLLSYLEKLGTDVAYYDTGTITFAFCLCFHINIVILQTRSSTSVALVATNLITATSLAK